MTDHMTSAQRLIAAHAESGQRGATFRALDAALGEAPGHVPGVSLLAHLWECWV